MYPNEYVIELINKEYMKRIFPILLLACVLETSCYEDEQLVDYDYINGQTMTFVPSLGSNVDSVVYYWDEVLIETKKEMPFVLVYPIQGQTSGSHIFSYTVFSTVNNESYFYSSSHKHSTTIRIK